MDLYTHIITIGWHGIFYIIKMAYFGLIKKAFYTRGIWEALGYMLWHGYTTKTSKDIVGPAQAWVIYT